MRWRLRGRWQIVWSSWTAAASLKKGRRSRFLARLCMSAHVLSCRASLIIRHTPRQQPETGQGMQQFIFTFFNADIAARYWPDIVRSMGVTIMLSLAVVAAGLLLGLALAIVRAAQKRALVLLVVMFADIMRALPPLIIIIVLFFAFPYIDLAMSAFTATWLDRKSTRLNSSH